MIKFTECLNDGWDYFFLADPALLSGFKNEHQLPDDLIQVFTTSNIADSAVEKGVIIPLSEIANLPYHIFFQINTPDSVFANRKSDLQFKKEGYLLRVIANEIYLITLPYLKDWRETGGIAKLATNGIRPRVHLENGLYSVVTLGGETQQESGWEPTIEFVLTQEKNEIPFTAMDINFTFEITAREH